MDEQFIGNYKVVQKIGAGGMAKVYLAVHRDVPNLKVILKILSDPRLGERFKQEADKLALLDGHASICRIKHFFNHGEDTVIAMEYIDGHTLDQAMKNQGGLTVAESARIAMAVLDTLDFAHQKKIFHRDIKPSNVMVDSTGQVKIIDFGIAKAESDPNLTIAGTACGTPAYMAPEQFNPAEDINYALTDIYAVGTTLYYMVCGELPFKGTNEFAIRDEKLFSDPARPSTLCKNLPKELEAVILKAMHKEPSKRFQSAREMKQAIEAIHLAPSTAKVAPDRTHDIKTGKPRTKKKGNLPMILGAVAVLVVAALGYFFWPREVSAPAAPELSRPWDETILDVTNRPTFSWKGSAGEGGTYILEYAGNESFAGSTQKTGLTETSLTAEEPLENGDYFWRVRAVGADGQMSPYSAVSSFTVEMPPPAAAAKGMLLVTVNSASDIYVGDSLCGKAANRYEIEMDTGLYAVRVENQRSNEKVRRETVRVTADQTAEADFRFTFPQARPEPPPAALSGKLAVLSIPTGAVVFVDGVMQRDIHTPHTLTLEPGRRVIKAILPESDNQTMETTIDIEKGGDNRVMFNFEQDTVLLNF